MSREAKVWAMDRFCEHLMDQHREAAFPHPLALVLSNPGTEPGDAGAALDAAVGCVAYTSDPDDARLLTVLCNVVFPAEGARQRLKDFVVAHLGDHPEEYLAKVGEWSRDLGINAAEVQAWFLRHMGPVEGVENSEELSHDESST